MRVLIIGGVSFIGLAVISQLLEGGHEVAVLHRGGTEPDAARRATHIHGDRDDLETLRPQIAAFQPEVAIHMIAMTQAQARTFSEALSGIVSRAVVISSQDVYRAFGRVNGTEPGPPDPSAITEESPLREHLYPYKGEQPRASDDPQRWMDEYDKILVERVVMTEPAFPCSILRLPAVYGPRDRQRRFGAWLQRMDDGRPAILMDAAEASWRWTFGYVEDVAHAIVMAALDPRSGNRIYNVGEQTPLSQEERLQMVARAAGWRGRVVLAPTGALPEPLRMGIDPGNDIVVDSSRIRAELGYVEPTPLAEAYARAIAWERANPPQDAAARDYAEEDRLLTEFG